MQCISQLIDRWKADDDCALNQLIAVSYDRLHTSARQALGYYGNNASIQTTELVSELYLHFRAQREVRLKNAQHFFAISALKLRQILNSRHEKKNAGKRNHGQRSDVSEIEREAGRPSTIEMLILNHSLDFIESLDPTQARIAELKLLWEFEIQEVAEILGVSESTVRRKWNVVKLILAKRITEHEANIE